MRGVMALEKAPLAEERLVEIKRATHDRTTHIIFLFRAGEPGLVTYPIEDAGELELAQREVEAGRRIIGYDLHITCGARDVLGELEVGSFAENIRHLTGWEVSIDHRGKTFTVLFRLEGESQQEGYTRIAELEEALIAISIKNKIGCDVLNVAWGPRYAAQPFSIVPSGRPTPIPREIGQDDIERIRRSRDKLPAHFLSDLAKFYGRVTYGSKVIFGFSLLEGLFDEKPEHILSDDEVSMILRKASEIGSIASNQAKIERLEKTLKDASLMAKKTRNERIAQNVAKLMNISEEVASEKIRALSKARGKRAHSTTENIEGLSEAFAFIEEILDRYMSS
jgi:hypothetical protein